MPVSLLSRPGLLAALLGVIAVIWAARNLPWHLDDYDQAKQAYVSYEMVKDGRWWLQHTPAGKIATKPPLVGWISAGLWKATGGWNWDFAWRLPGIAAAVILLWVLARLGREIMGWEGAFLAVAAFGCNLVAPRLTTLVRTDMVLACFIGIAGFLIYEKLRRDEPWTTADRWKMFFIVLGSMLTKGPIAYAFLLPGIVAWWWLQRRHTARVGAWSGWWSWFAPLAVFGAWVAIGWRTTPEFYEQVVQREFLGRFTVGEKAVHNNQPVYFYLLHLLRDFAPWSVALIAMTCVREVRARVRRDPALLWLVCWAVGGFICMSLVPSKRGDRLFPVYLPLCLLVPAMASLLPELLRRRWGLATVAVAVLVSGGYTTVRAVESFRIHDEALTDFSARVRALPSRRLALVTGKDEGMLLYLDQLRFTRWEDAVDKWRAGEIDLLVAPVKYREDATRDLPDAGVLFLSRPVPEKDVKYTPEEMSQQARDKSSQYLCLARLRPE